MTDPNALAIDLIARTEVAVRKVAEIAVDTGITFDVADVVRIVEDDLPTGYPEPTQGGTRREMIGRMAADILSGEMYEDE